MAESLRVADKTGALRSKDLKRVTVDTTVEPKPVRHSQGRCRKLGNAEQDLAEWQTATEALLMVAEDRGPLVHARIGIGT